VASRPLHHPRRAARRRPAAELVCPRGVADTDPRAELGRRMPPNPSVATTCLTARRMVTS